MRSENSLSYEKKTFANIRRSMIECLDLSPKTTDEIAKDIGCSHITVQRHLDYLWDIGVVCPAKFKVKREVKELWIKR